MERKEDILSEIVISPHVGLNSVYSDYNFSDYNKVLSKKLIDSLFKKSYLHLELMTPAKLCLHVSFNH